MVSFKEEVKKRKWRFAIVFLLLIVAIWLLQVLMKPQSGALQNAKTQKVLVIGGSVAHGWKDTTGKGYIARAIQSLSKATKIPFQYIDRTIVGANSTQLATLYKNHYLGWLRDFKPNYVVISWGLLNDCLPKTPYSTFVFHLKQEIDEALQVGSTVIIATPPVTKATYTQFKKTEPVYAEKEIQLVKSMNNHHVILADVFDQMRTYLTAHHQTYVPYMGDGWHPNSAGHRLAGQLLYQDLLKKVE